MSSVSLLTASSALSDQLCTSSCGLTAGASTTLWVVFATVGDGDGGGDGAKPAAIVLSSLKPEMNVSLILVSRYTIWTRPRPSPGLNRSSNQFYAYRRLQCHLFSDVNPCPWRLDPCPWADPCGSSPWVLNAVFELLKKLVSLTFDLCLDTGLKMIVYTVLVFRLQNLCYACTAAVGAAFSKSYALSLCRSYPVKSLSLSLTAMSLFL